ncbi:MAG: hypothetical protein KZQ89_09755 [Candidatus Thiodiazotropha sp. (ex Lucinoma kastoroae)]|nr:hypothetical protein [Candidatus Thiodiazotropha sp. (ex Lucinoma kastoroae)]
MMGQNMQLRYTSDIVGKILGLHIFTRSIRDVLVIELENRLRDLLELDPDTTVHKLKSWYDWAQEIDNLFSEAYLLIEEGRRFFTNENFMLIKNYIANDEDRNKISVIKWDFNTGDAR